MWLGVADMLKVIAKGEQERDEHGRWVASSANAEEATAAHQIGEAAHGDLWNHLGEFETSVSDLENAASEKKDIEDELGEDEEYANEADQADYEERHDTAATAAADAMKDAHAKLTALRDKVQAHLDKLTKSLEDAALI